MKKPSTQYTKSGRINIAYQVFGSGPIDLVYIPGWISNIDLMWECPELVYFFEEIGKIARVILFDKRGTGLSDRVVDLSTIEERMVAANFYLFSRLKAPAESCPANIAHFWSADTL